eukprot:jgi/Tetstr1/434482/TSEL_023574.t1
MVGKERKRRVAACSVTGCTYTCRADKRRIRQNWRDHLRTEQHRRAQGLKSQLQEQADRVRKIGRQRAAAACRRCPPCPPRPVCCCTFIGERQSAHCCKRPD